jgi:diguanylate cyclase (GGDEF)-like protein
VRATSFVSMAAVVERDALSVPAFQINGRRFQAIERRMLLDALGHAATLTAGALVGGALVSVVIDPMGGARVLLINSLSAAITIGLRFVSRRRVGRHRAELVAAGWSVMLVADLFLAGLTSPLQRTLAITLMPCLPLLFAVFMPVRPRIQVIVAGAASVAVGVLVLTLNQRAPEAVVIGAAMAIPVGSLLSIPGSLWLRRRRGDYVAQMLRAAHLHRVAVERGRALSVRYREQAASARVDPLTGVGNRLGMAEELERRAASPSGRTALLLIDVDHFKRYNDAHGHLAGDRALRAIADVLAASVRAGDAVFRFGGEEFLVVLAKADQQLALSVAGRLRRSVLDLGLALDDETGHASLSISVGAAVKRQAPDPTLARTLADADVALYEAKRSGRNRVEISAGGIAPTAAS